MAINVSVYELDVQNGWEENTHTHTHSITVGFSPILYC